MHVGARRRERNSTVGGGLEQLSDGGREVRTMDFLPVDERGTKGGGDQDDGRWIRVLGLMGRARKGGCGLMG